VRLQRDCARPARRRVEQHWRDSARALMPLFKQIIANNRAGGWRKLKRELAPGCQSTSSSVAARSSIARHAGR
jgi:hypothetical protein